MAELVGTAEIRIDMNTQAAVRDLRQMVARADGPLRALKRRVSEVRQELRGLRGASVTVSVDDRTGPGVTAVKAAVRDLERLGPIRIRVDVDAQTAEIVRAARAMRDLRNDADGTSRALGILTLRATAATGALRALTTGARGAARALGTLATRATAAAAALGLLSVQARRLTGELDDLGGSARRAGDRLSGLRGRIGTVSTAAGEGADSAGGMGAALIGLATAAIPVAASAVSVAASVGAAGVALGAFTGAVAGQVVQLVELKEAEDKAADAAAEHGATSKQAAQAQAAYRSALDALPPATREAAVAFQVLSEEYRAWSDALAKDTMPVVTKSMAVFGALLPRLTPLVRGTSVELDRLMGVLGGIVQQDSVGRLSDSFAEFASGSISRATTRLAAFTQTANAGQIGANYREFMAYVRANGPLVSDTLSQLAQVAVQLVAGFSELGVSALTVVNALAGLVNAVPSSAISTFVQLYASLKLVQLGIAGVAAVASSGAILTGIATLRLFARAASFGRLGATIGRVTRSMSALQKATIGLGVLAVATLGISKLAEKARGAPPDVDRLTTSLKRLADTGRFTGELRDTFGSVDGLVAKIKQLQDETTKLKESAGAGTGFRIPGLDTVGDAVSGAINDMVKGSNSLNALKEDFKGVDQALAGLATSGHAKTAAQSFDQIKAAARAQGISVKELNRLFPEYQSAVAALKAEQQLVAAGMGLFGEQAVKTGEKLKAQKASADGLRQALVALNDVQRAGAGGMIAFEQAIDDTAKAAKENSGSLRFVNGELDRNSQEARNAETALLNLATRTDEAAGAARENGKSWEHVNGIYDRGRAKLIESAIQMGLNKTEAKALADQILQTPDKTAKLKGDVEDLKAKLATVNAALKAPSLTRPQATKLRGDLKDIKTKIADAKKRLGDPGLTKPERTKLRATIADLQKKATAAEKRLSSKKLTNPKETKIRATINDVKAKIASAKRRLNSPGLTRPQKAKIRAEISQLRSQAAAARRELASVRSRTVTLTVRRNYAGVAAGTARSGLAAGGLVQFAQGGPVRGYPHGGPVRGPGTDTSDSILARVSRNEFVMRAAAVRRYGVGLFESLNSMRLPTAAVNRQRAPDLSHAVGASAPRRALGGNLTVNNHVTVENRGVLGSQLEVEDWLAKSLDQLGRTGRLPAAAGRR